MKICSSSSYLLHTLIYITLLPVLEAQQFKVEFEMTGSLGSDVTLPCHFIQGPDNIRISQVQWNLLPPDGTEGNIVTIGILNPHLGLSIHESPLKGRVKFAEYSLIIKDVQMEDTGFYVCIIDTYPRGLFERITKLVVQEPPVRIVILPRMIAAGVFGLIVVTMVVTTHVIIIRIRRKALTASDLC